MPIYEYQCRQCDERHEIIQRFSDAPLTHCPSCGGEMKKLFSSPAIQFKGSGFYKTDYPSASSKPGGSSAPGSSDKTESKSDAKPESKSSETKSTDSKSSESKTSASRSGE